MDCLHPRDPWASCDGCRIVARPWWCLCRTIGWRLSRRRFVSLEFRPPRAAVKLRRPSIRRLRVSFRARRDDHGKLLFIEIRQHVEFGHDTSDKTRSPPVVICRSKGVSDGVSWQVFGGLPGPFGDRFRDLQAEGFQRATLFDSNKNLSVSDDENTWLRCKSSLFLRVFRSHAVD